MDNQWLALCNAAGQAFCNASPFCLRDLTSRAKKQTLKSDFEAYLDGFSSNVQEILEKFKFRNQIDTIASMSVDASIAANGRAPLSGRLSSPLGLKPLSKHPFYRLTANVEDASEEESAEVLSAIEGLTDDDLIIASSKHFNV